MKYQTFIPFYPCMDQNEYPRRYRVGLLSFCCHPEWRATKERRTFSGWKKVRYKVILRCFDQAFAALRPARRLFAGSVTSFPVSFEVLLVRAAGVASFFPCIK